MQYNIDPYLSNLNLQLDEEETVKETFNIQLSDVTLANRGVSFKIQDKAYTHMFDSVSKESKQVLVTIALNYFMGKDLTENEYIIIKNVDPLLGFKHKDISIIDDHVYLRGEKLLKSVSDLFKEVIKDSDYMYLESLNLFMYDLFHTQDYSSVYKYLLQTVLNLNLTINNNGYIIAYVPTTVDYTALDDSSCILAPGATRGSFSYDATINNDRGFKLYNLEQVKEISNYFVKVEVAPSDIIRIAPTLTTACFSVV